MKNKNNGVEMMPSQAESDKRIKDMFTRPFKAIAELYKKAAEALDEHRATVFSIGIGILVLVTVGGGAIYWHRHTSTNTLEEVSLPPVAATAETAKRNAKVPALNAVPLAPVVPTKKKAAAPPTPVMNAPAKNRCGETPAKLAEVTIAPDGKVRHWFKVHPDCISLRQATSARR